MAHRNWVSIMGISPRSFTAGLGGLGSALAADLPVKAPPRVPVAVYNWTGCYIGANVGEL